MKSYFFGKEVFMSADEYGKAVSGSGDKKKEIEKLGNLNEEAYEDLILSINHTTKEGNMAFSLVKNHKTVEYLEGNCKLAWDCLMAKYALM